MVKIFTASFCQQDLSKSVKKKTVGCIFDQTHDHVPLRSVNLFPKNCQYAVL